MSKVMRGRENWKEKAISRGEAERYERKEKIRIGKERDKYKDENKRIRKELDEVKNYPSVIILKVDLIYIALQLFLVARISFRAVSRVLSVLSEHLGIKKVPCPQTIINWTIKYSMVKIKNTSQLLPQMKPSGDQFSNGFIWMIDVSIGLGSGKILAVLAIDIHHYLSGKMPSLKDTHCIAVSVSASWTGELIAKFLKKVIAVSGRPTAYLKDGGSDLKKAVKLLGEEDLSSLTIDDISHKIANLFKHKYKDDPLFSTFISACGNVSKNFKQTLLACLAPPKVSTKARFMNLHRLVTWANKILKHSSVGRSAKGSVLSKLRESFDQLPDCKKFINQFLSDAVPLLECQKILKNKGLSNESYKECEKHIQQMSSSSSVRKGFVDWANDQLKTANKLCLSEAGLLITSDSIESLFGVGKRHGTGDTKDANQIALRLPALTGELTKQNAAQVLQIRVKEQIELTKNISSLTKQRRRTLNTPGSIETLATEKKESYFEFISESKKQSKSLSKASLQSGCEKINGLKNDLKNISVLLDSPMPTG